MAPAPSPGFSFSVSAQLPLRPGGATHHPGWCPGLSVRCRGASPVPQHKGLGAGAGGTGEPRTQGAACRGRLSPAVGQGRAAGCARSVLRRPGPVPPPLAWKVRLAVELPGVGGASSSWRGPSIDVYPTSPWGCAKGGLPLPGKRGLGPCVGTGSWSRGVHGCEAPSSSQSPSGGGLARECLVHLRDRGGAIPRTAQPQGRAHPTSLGTAFSPARQPRLP